jgi:SulP family sulfate permease
VLSAIALKVGFDILDWSFLKRAHYVSWTATMIMYGVMALTVLVDLIVAVGVGVFIANILTIERLTKLQSNSVKTIDPADDTVPLSEEERKLFKALHNRVVLFHLSGPMIFGVASAISRQQAAREGADVLVLDLRDVPLLSTTVALALENVVKDAHEQGLHVLVAGASSKVHGRLQRLFSIEKTEGIAYHDTLSDALTAAAAFLKSKQTEKVTGNAEES